MPDDIDRGARRGAQPPSGTARGSVAALLLAAGVGARLRPLTETTPKCLIEIGGRPLIDRWLDALDAAGVREIRVNTHHLAERVRAHLARRGGELSASVVESHEPVLLGSAGTVNANRSLADDVGRVLVVYADNVSDIDIAALLRFHETHDDPVTMALFRAENPSACGIAELDGAGRIVGFVEKPESPASDLANAGVYVFSTDAFREMADLHAFDIGHDVLPRFVSRMRGFVWDGTHVDIGTHEALARVRRNLEMQPWGRRDVDTPPRERRDVGTPPRRAGRLRVAVCFDLYEPFHLHKEGNLVLGLAEAGAEPCVVTAQAAMRGVDSPFPVHVATRAALDTERYWRALDVDVVLAYTFLNWRYTPLLRAIRAAGTPLVVRADSDGYIGHPVQPRRLRLDPPWSREGAKNLARRAAWRLAPSRMASRRLEHLALPDRIFIESPHAFAALAAFVTHWGRADLLARVACIPMTISNTAIEAPLVPKARRIVAVGRWSDARQKNTAVAARVLEAFLAERSDYRATVIGDGAEVFRRHLTARSDVSDRLEITGPIPQDAALAHVAAARILFMPSNWEGFALAAGEAVCLGCSLVATPLGTPIWLSMGGRFGTIAESFAISAILGALHVEVSRWERGERDPEMIASTWRGRIDRRTVGKQLLALCEEACNVREGR